MTNSEAIAVCIRTLRRRFADEPMPACGSPECAEFQTAQETIIANPTPAAFTELGFVAFRLLTDAMLASIHAERAALVAAHAAAQQERPPGESLQ